MIHSEVRYAHHPDDVQKYTTEELRKHFLIEGIFEADMIKLTYSMYDRFIVGGTMPVKETVSLESFDDLKSDYFLERRELGIINVGGTGMVNVDGNQFILNRKEALYVGKGSKEVLFQSEDSNTPALFYLNSTPAHKEYPTTKIGRGNAEIVHLGEDSLANKRVLNKLIVNSIVPTCQLQMGLTELIEGNVWNTMPAHVHARRMEAYFYFDIQEGQTLAHFMGEPTQTRHLFLRNHTAVLSPEWSIHSGVGTSNYAFVWGMAGENLDYGDMDVVLPQNLK